MGSGLIIAGEAEPALHIPAPEPARTGIAGRDMSLFHNSAGHWAVLSGSLVGQRTYASFRLLRASRLAAAHQHAGLPERVRGMFSQASRCIQPSCLLDRHVECNASLEVCRKGRATDGMEGFPERWCAVFQPLRWRRASAWPIPSFKYAQL